MKFVSLIKIDPAANNNKFYKMTQADSATFKAEWGRVGATGQSAVYPMSQWDAKYKDKTKGGYKDNTDSTAVKSVAVASGGAPGSAVVAPIANPDVRALIDKLRAHSAQAVAANYTVTVVKVTQVAIDRAQGLIDQINGRLALNADISVVNALLVDLYGVIPRKIADVRKAVVQFPLDDQVRLDVWKSQMAVEQALLDAMATQVHAAAHLTAAAAPGTNSVISILDQLGLDIDVVDAATTAHLKTLMTDSSHRFVKAFAVKNRKAQAKFDAALAGMNEKRVEEFFHGSRAENWYSILENGLALRPNAVTTGKLFGHGIYFAKDADKSLGYIDGGRWNGAAKASDAWLAVFSVAVGKPLEYKKATPRDPQQGSMNYAKLQSKGGYDSFWVKAGYMYSGPLRKDEIIVYKEEQCTVKYLIQITP